MTKETIAELLQSNHEEFFKLLQSLPKEEYLREPNGKWSPGQHLDHILRAVKPVNLALSMPGFILRFKFGKANRPSREFEKLVERYKEKLAAGGKAGAQFIPPAADWAQRDKLIQKLRRQVEQLSEKTRRCSEEKLDRLILPHPLLGKLTLREMLYFTIYHVSHHQKAINA